MQHKTKLALAAIHQLCDAEDKSTEYMYQLMQDTVNVDINTINNYMMIENKKELFDQVMSVVDTINKLQ